MRGVEDGHFGKPRHFGRFLKTGPGTPLGVASLWYRYRLISAIGLAVCKHTIQYKYNNMPWRVKIIQVIQI